MALTWRVARGIGSARRWLTSAWRPPALWTAAGVAALYAVDRWITALSWVSFWSGLAVAIVVAFGVAVWRARERVVVEAFVDYNRAATSPEDGGAQAVAPGLSDALVSELASLRELYRTAGERTAGSASVVEAGDARPVDAGLELQDVSEFLRNASTGDSKVSVGPFALPIGTVLAMLGRLAQGPRVTGGLQVIITPGEADRSEAGEVVLTAYYAGPRHRASWSVRELLPDYAASLVKDDRASSVAQTAIVRKMIQELAARMFADLALRGTRSWLATRRSLEGLQQYRLAHESRQDRVLRLQQAERAFIEALAHDEQLPLARYNLGIVYRELHGEARDQHYDEAAANAFRRELQSAHPGWQAYYALALTYFDWERYTDVSTLCDRVIELSRGSGQKAIAYGLKGLAQRLEPGTGPVVSVASHRRAVAYALVALCRAELATSDRTEERAVLARNLLNLGVAIAYAGLGTEGSPRSPRERRSTLRACHGLLFLASRLENAFPPRFQLAKIAFSYDAPHLAIAQLRAATRIDPGSDAAWAWLARINASLAKATDDPQSRDEWQRRSRAADQSARANLDLDLRPSAVDATQRLAEALRDLGEPDEADRTLRIPTAEATLSGEVDVTSLEARLEAEPDFWMRGHLAYRIADIHRESQRFGESASFYGRALEALKGRYEAEVRRLGLQGMVAMMHTWQEGSEAPLHEALQEAQEAIAVDPLSSWERETLGQVHERIGDYENAIAAFEYALFWSPNSAKLHSRLGGAHLKLAEETSDPARRSDAYARATAHLESALALQPQSALQERARAHFALGRAYSSLDAYERAVPHYRNALAAREAAPLVQVLLGEAFIRKKRYDLAEDALSVAISTAEATVRDDPRSTIGDSLDEPWAAADLAALAHRFLALSFIERDVGLNDARNHLREARQLRIRSGEADDPVAQASERELEGRILLEEGEIDKAIASLNEAIGLSVDAESYLHLAGAYAGKASTSTGIGRIVAIKKARRACRHAQDLDVSGLFREAITSIQSEVDALATAETPGGGARRISYDLVPTSTGRHETDQAARAGTSAEQTAPRP